MRQGARLEDLAVAVVVTVCYLGLYAVACSLALARALRLTRWPD